MLRLSARIFRSIGLLSAASLLLASCSEVNDELGIFQDDVEVVSETTVDVERENMEVGALGVIEALYLPAYHLPLFKSLDASASAAITCVSGSVERDVSTPAQGLYGAGDYVNLRYQDCMQSNGDLYDGVLNVRYDSVRGLNTRFEKLDTQACIAALNARAGQILTVVENRDDSGELFPADAVRITKQSVGSQVEFLRLAEAVGGDDQVSTVVRRVALDDTSLVIHRSVERDEQRSTPDQPRYKLQEMVLPSLDGDQLYTLDEGIAVLEHCQQYDRSMTASAQGFSVAIANGRKIILDGTLSLYEGSADLEALTQNVQNSAYQVRVVSEQRQSTYQLERVELQSARSADASGSARYVFSALLSSQEFPGTYAVVNNNPIFADLNNAQPRSGRFTAIGRDQDQLNVTLRNSEVILSAATEGDTSGNGRADTNASFTTFWQDLLNRNFVILSDAPE